MDRGTDQKKGGPGVCMCVCGVGWGGGGGAIGARGVWSAELGALGENN